MRYLYQRILLVNKVPERVRRTFGGLPPVKLDEELLFRDVCARAVLDAVGVTGAADARDHNDIVRLARTWLRFGSNKDDFFDHAGLDMDAVIPETLAIDPPYRRERK